MLEAAEQDTEILHTEQAVGSNSKCMQLIKPTVFCYKPDEAYSPG